MTKLKSSLLNMFLSLTVTCTLAGAVLAAVHNATGSRIADAKKAKLNDAIKSVLPPFDNNPTDEARMVALSEGDSLTVYPAGKNGQPVGAAVESNSRKGFSGEIKILVGLDTAGHLIDYKVLEHAETPGLGAKMDEWFRTEKNQQNVLGKNLFQATLKVKKDGGSIDAITAATISSRAFLDAINRACAAFSGNENADATSEATSAAAGEAVVDTATGEALPVKSIRPAPPVNAPPVANREEEPKTPDSALHPRPVTEHPQPVPHPQSGDSATSRTDTITKNKETVNEEN